MCPHALVHTGQATTLGTEHQSPAAQDAPSVHANLDPNERHGTTHPREVTSPRKTCGAEPAVKPVQGSLAVQRGNKQVLRSTRNSGNEHGGGCSRSSRQKTETLRNTATLLHRPAGTRRAQRILKIQPSEFTWLQSVM